MKRLILFIAATGLLLGCNHKHSNLKEEMIKNRILQNAMGANIHYKPVSTDTVAIVRVSESLNDYLQKRCHMGTVDSALIMCNWIMNDAQQKDAKDEYNVWSFYKSRITSLAAKKGDDVDYEVMKHSYTINNPLMNNAQVNITDYYFFNAKDSIIGELDEDDFKDFKREDIKNANDAYEDALFKFAYY